MLVGQIQNHKSLSWDIEPMHPHEGVEHPACGRVLNAVTFLVWEGRSVRLEGGADALFESRIDEPTDGHAQQQGHHPLGLFEIKRRG